MVTAWLVALAVKNDDGSEEMLSLSYLKPEVLPLSNGKSKGISVFTILTVDLDTREIAICNLLRYSGGVMPFFSTPPGLSSDATMKTQALVAL